MTTENNENLFLWTKNNKFFKFYRFIRKLGIKNPWNIYSGLKHRCFRWIFDWIFSENYYFISNERYLMARNFKEYHSNKDKYQNLVKDLDFESIHLIDRYFNVVNTILWNRGLCLPSELLSISDNPKSKKITKNIKEYVKNLYIPTTLLAEVWFYKHWINHISNIWKYTKWKDIIDCGAFIWDSALMFNKELEINKIFCCEPDPKNYEILNKVIKKNHKQNKLFPIKFWVWSKKCELRFDNGKGWASWISQDWKTIIKIDTIDNLVVEHNINPWLIKRDIEWAEYDSLLWAEKTIKKYKPILVISIYHTPKDFFEIKPLLESWNLWYKFKIIHCSEWTSLAEIMLLAYID